MEIRAEPASFRADDDPVLVAAALSCRMCLSGDVDWHLAPSDWDPEVVTRCRDCGDERSICLNPDQALRLSLAPV